MKQARGWQEAAPVLFAATLAGVFLSVLWVPPAEPGGEPLRFRAGGVRFTEPPVVMLYVERDEALPPAGPALDEAVQEAACGMLEVGGGLAVEPPVAYEIYRRVPGAGTGGQYTVLAGVGTVRECPIRWRGGGQPA